MSLRNRFANFFNKSKSPEASAAQSSEQSSEQEQLAGHDAVTWDSLAVERQGDDRPKITYDDLARLVRFPGSTPSEPSPAEDKTGATPEAFAKNDLEIANGGGSLSDELTPSALATETASTLVATDHVDPSITPESQESEPISPELQAFKNFFKTDMRVKRELIDAAPKPTDDYDEASRMDYVEDAYRTFRDFKHDFLGIARDFGFGEYVTKSTEDFFRRGQQDFALGSYGPGVAQALYRKAFTDMRPDFIEEVKENFVGHQLFGGDLGSVVHDASTVNELLHAYHSCIMNSDGILRRIPPLAEKKALSNNDAIVLRGDHSALGQQVFDSFPEGFDVGDTDIVSADDHIMMMVRDRGHALTISSEPDTDDPTKIWVSYNVPKICNEEMIKALLGLAGYTQNGARGSFVVLRDELGSSIVDFIAKVPTDNDIPPYNYEQ